MPLLALTKGGANTSRSRRATARRDAPDQSASKREHGAAQAAMKLLKALIS